MSPILTLASDHHAAASQISESCCHIRTQLHNILAECHDVLLKSTSKLLFTLVCIRGLQIDCFLVWDPEDTDGAQAGHLDTLGQKI